MNAAWYVIHGSSGRGHLEDGVAVFSWSKRKHARREGDRAERKDLFVLSLTRV